MSISAVKRRYWGGVFRLRSLYHQFVCKTGDANYNSDCEADMLGTLAAAGLCVPRTFHCEPGLLVMEDMRVVPAGAETLARAGAALAKLHLDTTSQSYGFHRSPAFGTLQLDEGRDASWVRYFIQFRLLAFLAAAERSGNITQRRGDSVRAVAERLSRLLPEPTRPALLHGDIWNNNVLARGSYPVFLDPSVLYGDPDYEVAFLARYLHGHIPVLKAYRAIRPIDYGHWRIKRSAYWLAFDLAHLALFGSSFEKNVLRAVRSLEAL